MSIVDPRQNVRQSAAAQRGFSLAELMIAVGISSVLSLTIVTLITETSKNSAQLQRQSDLSRDTEGFIYALEQYMGQAVQVINCACEADGSPCENTALNEAPNYGGATPAFTFVHENAMDPKSTPGTGCLYNGVATIPGSTIIPQGCKRVIELRYVRPTVTAPPTPSMPGQLQLVWTMPNTAPNSAGGTVLASLSGVTRFACSMSQVNGTNLSNSDLIMRIETKSRLSNSNDTTKSEYETWSRDATDPAASTYRRGLHRSHVVQISFRNITTPGIQFGKIRQVKDCKVVDPSTGVGEVANNANECCSGYRNPVSGRCVNAASCVRNTGTGAAPAAPGGVDDQCCSRMASGGVCL